MLYSNKVLLDTGQVKYTNELNKEDELIGFENQPVFVLNKQIIQSTDIYKIATKSGTEFYATAHNLLAIFKNNRLIGVPISDIVTLSDTTIKNKKYKLVRIPEVEFNACKITKQELPIEPYLFGLLLVNSSSFAGGIKMTITNEIAEKKINIFLKKHDMTKKPVAKGTNNSYQLIKNKHNKEKNPLYKIFEDLELADVKVKNRFIPEIYKTASVKQRYELLAAICDSSGTINGSGYQITTASILFAEDVVFIARTLGLNANYRKVYKNKKPYYIINLGGYAYKIPCLFKKVKEPDNASKHLVRTFTIEYLGIGDFLDISASDKYLLDDCTIVN